MPKPGAEQCATKSAEGLFPSASCNTLTIHTYDLRMAPDSTKDMNSAERLHAYLALFGDSRRKRPQKDLLGIWDDLLGSHDRGELPELDVAKLVALVADVQTTAKVLELQGKPLPLRHVEENIGEWLKPFFFTGVEDLERLDEDEDISVSHESLSALELIGEIFRTSALRPDGLDDDQVAELVTQFGDLTRTVQEASDLPDELRLRLLTVLYAILQALNDYAIGGPRAVEIAVDGLTATLFRLGDHRDQDWWRTAMAGAKDAYAALGVAVTLRDGGQLVYDGAEMIRQITGSG